jgi:hypothetical protein
MSSPGAFGFSASGNISQARFVVGVPGGVTAVTGTPQTDFLVRQCTGATDLPIVGVSFSGSQNFPTAGDATAYAATNGKEFRVWLAGEQAFIQLGGSVAAWDRLTGDINGCGISVTATGVYVGGQALRSGASGEWIPFMVAPYTNAGSSNLF